MSFPLQVDRRRKKTKKKEKRKKYRQARILWLPLLEGVISCKT